MEKEKIDFAMRPMKFNMAALSPQPSLWRKSHIHDAIEIVYVTGGTLCVHVNDEKIILDATDTILINSNVPHYLEDVRSAEASYIQIEMREYCDILKKTEFIYDFVNRQNVRPYCLGKGKNELGDIFLAIQNEMREKDAYYEMYIKAYINLLVPFMLRHNIISPANGEMIAKSEKLLPLAKYIEKNYMRQLTLEECSAVIGYTRFELCRKFKSATGVTVAEYINHVRLYHAKKLLKQGKSVAEIAFQCGFSSIQYFDRIFKKYNACTPGEYKKYML